MTGAGAEGRANGWSRARACGSTSRRARRRSPVPNVIGRPYDAAAVAAAGGWASSSTASDVESTDAGGQVVEPVARGRERGPQGLDRDAQRLEGPDRRRRCRTSTGQDEDARERAAREAGYKVKVVDEPTDDPILDETSSSRQNPPAGRRARAGSTGDARRPLPGRAPAAADDRRDDPTTPREPAPRRRARGRALERARDLARVGAFGARALDPAATTSSTVEIGRDGRWELRRGASRRAESSGLDRARRCRCPADSSAARRSARSTSCSRSCTGRSARTARSRGCSSSPDVPVRRRRRAASALCMDKDLFKAVLRDQRHPGRAARDAAARRPSRRIRSATRSSSSRRGSGRRSASRRCTARGAAAAVELASAARREGARRGVRRGRRGRVRRARQRAPPIASLPGEIVAARRVVRLRREVRRGRHGPRRPAADCRGDDRARAAARRRRRSSRPSARAWRASTASCATTARCSSTS